MLRNRSKSVTSKQALMATSPSQKNFIAQIPSFIAKKLNETEALNSPSSTLDNKSSFHYNINQPKSPKYSSAVKNIEPKEFGTELRVQIPLIPPDFGTKTKNLHTLSPPFTSPKTSVHMKDPPMVFNGCFPVKEIMELSEDYTCVISHGPNPKTTHIFHDCVVECCCSISNTQPKSAPSESNNFLSFCHTCKKNLRQKIDIYIYRGDKAFCSQECRYQEMVLDGEEN
ncbi:hypothetical protein ES332_A12G004500v1 [Gossypium tomentosum]|uniref:FLZ-type domain-containing protein n=1 Tax=Gossypium tomentosum TaxID=34277 RepID=A0A5D2MRD8_GOSTO|nr:hypothetical protein ES332_A12G004500v1 [Gossypium tomentosum]